MNYSIPHPEDLVKYLCFDILLQNTDNDDIIAADQRKRIQAEMSKVYIYTDGACSGNPGPGGWGAILRWGDLEREMSGGDSMTTNNRMELSAVINALSALKRPCEVVLTTDSRYVCDSVTKGWVYNWRKKGWVRSGTPVPNTDLWQKLLPLLETHDVEFRWVRGHAGHPENERCDALAVAQAQKCTRK